MTLLKSKGFLAPLVILVLSLTFSLSAQKVEVKSRIPGKALQAGQNNSIEWAKFQSPETKVKIILIHADSRQKLLDIATNVPNNGFFDWLVPNALKAGKFRIRIMDAAGKSFFDSEPFEIALPNPPVGQTNSDLRMRQETDTHHPTNENNTRQMPKIEFAVPEKGDIQVISSSIQLDFKEKTIIINQSECKNIALKKSLNQFDMQGQLYMELKYKVINSSDKNFNLQTKIGFGETWKKGQPLLIGAKQQKMVSFPIFLKPDTESQFFSLMVSQGSQDIEIFNCMIFFDILQD
jgi:hypothetical protein